MKNSLGFGTEIMFGITVIASYLMAKRKQEKPKGHNEHLQPLENPGF